MLKLFFWIMIAFIFYILLVQDNFEYAENVKPLESPVKESEGKPKHERVDISYGTHTMMKATSEIGNAELVLDCISGEFNYCFGTKKPNVIRNEVEDPDTGKKILLGLTAIDDIKRGDDVIVVNAERRTDSIDGKIMSDKIYAKTHINEGDEIYYIPIGGMTNR